MGSLKPSLKFSTLNPKFILFFSEIGNPRRRNRDGGIQRQRHGDYWHQRGLHQRPINGHRLRHRSGPVQRSRWVFTFTWTQKIFFLGKNYTIFCFNPQKKIICVRMHCSRVICHMSFAVLAVLRLRLSVWWCMMLHAYGIWEGAYNTIIMLYKHFVITTLVRNIDEHAQTDICSELPRRTSCLTFVCHG